MCIAVLFFINTFIHVISSFCKAVVDRQSQSATNKQKLPFAVSPEPKQHAYDNHSYEIGNQ